MEYRPQENPLYSMFKYTSIKGLDYHNGDGTVSRRDPSKIIKVNNNYYMWYTKRETKYPPIGAKNAAQATNIIPSTDWDLSDIWYATSKDGFTWKEQGLAVHRPKKPIPGWRSIATPDILVWKNKYYLYFQCFNEPSGLKGDDCSIAMAYSDSPDGPWTYVNKVAIPIGKKGEWDEKEVQDPYPLVHNGKIYVYYKSAFNRPDRLWVAHGLCTSNSPFGPFVKSVKNPISNSGHETAYFPFKKGVAAWYIADGMENNTIQYAENWEDFEIASYTKFVPVAPGPYIPDAFTDTKDGKGINWGVCHFVNYSGDKDKLYSIIARFDCNLTQTNLDKSFKQTRLYLRPEVYLSRKMSKTSKDNRLKEYSLK